MNWLAGLLIVVAGAALGQDFDTTAAR